MGLNFVGVSSCRCKPYGTYVTNTETPKEPPNPKPKNFKILEMEQVGKYLIARIKYHDCTNFEGIKILVIEGVSRLKLFSLAEIDPHFCDNSNHEYKVIARFRPEYKYWRFAVALCKSMTEELK